LAELEPKTVKSALSNDKWRRAMQDEYKALMDWTIIHGP
jgi:hypothetical protein